MIQKIIQLNTQSQLYQKGIDSTGTSLASIGGEYSPYTDFIKQYLKQPAQPIDRVTLKDTGAFYASWQVFLNGNSELEITNDPIKDGINLLDRWGKNVLGLTDESLGELQTLVKTKMPDIVRNLILKQAA